MYGNGLGPEKQAITNKWKMLSTSRGPSTDVQVVS